MALLHHTIIFLFLVLHAALVINGQGSESESEENESTVEESKGVCSKLEGLFRKLCLGNPDRRFCKVLQRKLKRKGCTPACTTCEQVEQTCQADCAEGNVVPGLCAPNQQCCLNDTDSGLAECPTGDAGVTCEAADTCTGSGGTLDSDFDCATDGEMCCRRTCPTTEAGVSCESAATCTGSGATQDTGFSCPSEGQVCCRRVCPENPGLVNCEQPRCSDGFFVMDGFPCPNEGDLCCEFGLGRR